MKMHYQRSNTSKRVMKYILPLIPTLVAVLLVVSHVPVPSAVTNSAHTLATPFWHVRDALRATVDATYTSLDSTEALVAENIALHNELSAMRRENFMARIHKRENETLRQLLGRSTEAQQEYHIASVVNDDTYSPYDSFVIDIGAEGGVEEHMLVLSPEGFAVGSVERALTSTAIVTKFSAPTIETEVLLTGTTTIHTVVQGMGGGTMLIRVPRDLEVSVGSEVLLPTFSSNPIGVVALVEVTPQDAYQTVYVQSPVNIHQLQYVFVDPSRIWNPIEPPPELATTTVSVVEEER
jgi:cell shape-determining protein MreC